MRLHWCGFGNKSDRIITLSFEHTAAVLLFASALLSMSGTLLATHPDTRAGFAVVALIALLGIAVLAII
jgi:hypothetical protein